MKKLVWVAAAILVVSFIFPNGISLPKPTPVPQPAPTAQPDKDIVRILSAASAADKRRIGDVYSGLRSVLARDKGQRVSTTEKFADFHANALQLAVNHQPGKYPDLDVAIDAVFERALGTTDVVALNDATVKKLIEACDIVVASTK